MRRCPTVSSSGTYVINTAFAQLGEELGKETILLGTYILGAGGEVSRWAYEVIFVVVAFR